MESSILIVVAVAAAAIAAVVVAAFFRRKRGVTGPGESEQIRKLEEELGQLRESKAETERRLATEECTASRVPGLEDELRERVRQLEELYQAKASSDIERARAQEAASNLGQTNAANQARITELETAARAAAERIEGLLREKAEIEESEAAKSARLAAAEQQVMDLKARLEGTERNYAELSTKFEETGRDKAGLEAELAKKSATLTEKAEAVETLRRDLEEMKGQYEAVRKSAAELSSQLATATERLEQEMAKAAEKIALLTDAREDMVNQFKTLAEGVMTRHGEAFTKQNKEQVEGLLAPLKEKIVEFERGLQAAQTETAKERAALGEQIRGLSEASAKMTSETHNLTKALKGKAQTQGAWGELILETILEKSGLREGDEYTRQENHTDDEGGRRRTDVIVNLPGGQRVVIDSKVSLKAFEEHVNASNEEEAAAALARHISSVKAHIRTLANKDYTSVVGSGVDYVIMFIPIEGALAVALKEQPDLTAEAVKSNVAIATPTTLMMALRTIANVWGVERRNRNAEVIAKRAGLLYEKFIGFADDMETLGGQLDRAKGSFDAAMGKLSTGSGNLVRQVEMLKELGAKTNKSMPVALLEDASQESLPESLREPATAGAAE